MASKKKVIAVTEIHRTVKPGQHGDKSKGISPVKPTVQIIAPKTVFMASTEADRDDGTSEFDRLLAAKAIREPEKDEKVQVDIENVVPEDENSKKTNTTKTTNKSSSKSTNKSSSKSTKGTESGTTKTSDNSGTTTSGSQTGAGGDGDGNDLV